MGDEDEMNIVHVISSLDVSSGGPSKSVSELAIEQAQLVSEVTIITRKSSDPYINSSPIKNLNLKFLINGISRDYMRQHISLEDTDVYHGHGIWEMPVHYMASIARHQHRKHIISTRGMLEPVAYQMKKWKKQLAMAFYQRSDLSASSCIHVTSKNEGENLRKMGFINPIAVIPNGVRISSSIDTRSNQNRNVRIIQYLSRIHPIKGIENLIKAWSKVSHNLKNGWVLSIVGDGEREYVDRLKLLSDSLNEKKDVRFSKAIYGDEKAQIFNEADVVVLPSFSENFGVVVAEALSYGIPVITTKGAPWEDLLIHNAGWWVDIGVDPLVDALQTALRMSDSQRQQMGQNGQELVRQKYDIRTVAKQSLQLYNWIISGGTAPDFMYD